MIKNERPVRRVLLGLGLLYFFIALFGADAWAVKFKNCSQSQQKRLWKADRDVSTFLMRANSPKSGIDNYNLDYVLNEYVRPKKMVRNDAFKNQNVYAIYRQFHRKTKNNLKVMKDDIMSGLTYECVSNRSSRCNGGDTYAYVLFLLGTDYRLYDRIFFCGSAFSDMNETERARTLIHELSHYSVSTDHFMGPWPDRKSVMRETDSAIYYSFFYLFGIEHVASEGTKFLWRREYVDSPESQDFDLGPDQDEIYLEFDRCGTHEVDLQEENPLF